MSYLYYFKEKFFEDSGDLMEYFKEHGIKPAAGPVWTQLDFQEVRHVGAFILGDYTDEILGWFQERAYDAIGDEDFDEDKDVYDDLIRNAAEVLCELINRHYAARHCQALQKLSEKECRNLAVVFNNCMEKV